MGKPILVRPRFDDDGRPLPDPPTKAKPAHLWKPGQSGNPGGHPGVLTETVRRRMDYINDDGRTNAEVLVDAQMRKARRGDTDAAKFLADRGYGKPIQPSVVEHRKSVVKVVEVPPLETREEWLARCAKLHQQAEEIEAEERAAEGAREAGIKPNGVN